MKKWGARETSACRVGLSCCGAAGFYIYAVSMNLLKVNEVLASENKLNFLVFMSYLDKYLSKRKYI